METVTAHDLIVSIKRSIAANHLSFQDVKSLLAEHKIFPGDTTLRRLMKQGSEDNDSFNMAQTLVPIARVLGESAHAEDDATQAQLDLYRQLVEYKHETIESLKKQVEHLKEQQTIQCNMCGEKMDILKQQIELKDKRMDEQARRIDKLMDKLLEKI